MNHRNKFDLAIGRLDRVLSELVSFARSNTLDAEDKQTLKHHCEDMEAAAKHIYKKIGIVEGTPQVEAISTISYYELTLKKLYEGVKKEWKLNPSEDSERWRGGFEAFYERYLNRFASTVTPMLTAKEAIDWVKSRIDSIDNQPDYKYDTSFNEGYKELATMFLREVNEI